MQVITILIGMLVFVGIAVLISENRKYIRLRTVLGAFALQLLIACFIFYVPFGKGMLLYLTGSVSKIMEYASSGINFIFGELANNNLGFIFAFHVLPVIVFISAFVAVLYYLGIMQKIVAIVGGFLQRVLGTSKAESMAATSNIFVGNSDVFILMKPYVKGMTKSELFALMTGGLASIAGAVLVGYASMGVSIEFLLAASFMSAPGGLLMAKLIFPETESAQSLAKPQLIENSTEQPVNVIEAATMGAASGMNLALNIGAMLLALIALISLLDGLLGGTFSLLGFQNVTLQSIFSYVFAPFAFLLGVQSNEIFAVSGFIGQKLVLNEFVAFSAFIDSKSNLTEYSQMITTVALAGFANLSAPAVLIGVLGAMVPEKKAFIAKNAWKVIVAGLLANLMSAAICGLLFVLCQA